MQSMDQTLISAFREGNFSFAYGLNPAIFALLVVLIIAGVWWTYASTTRAVSKNWKTFFISLRSLVLILLLFCLLRPIMTIIQVSPQESYLAVVIDDSQSMSIQDLEGSQSRQQAVKQMLFDNGVIDELADTFQIRLFSFDKQAQRINDLDVLQGQGTSSSLGEALNFVGDQLSGLPLAGIVLLSDGADNMDGDPLASAREFGAAQVPIFSVGVGQTSIPQDIGIVDVSAAKTVLEGSVFTVQVALLHEGYEGQEIELSINDGDIKVVSEKVILGAAGVTRRFDLELKPERAELIVYDLNVELMDDEIISANNSYSFLVDNSEKQSLDVLYVEGHPRNEYKFIRRAVETDKSIRLATYLQTGPEKYYRQGIESATELSGGFPNTKQELFQYEALILGDISKNFFTNDQLQMIEDFVAERGGGFLMSGMADEDYVDTPIADILPITLVEENFLPPHLRGGTRRGDHPTGETFYPRLTNSGEYSPLLRLSGDDAENLALWQQLPALQGTYVTGRAKPGASVLLEHPLLQFQNQALPIIASQRFGRGRAMTITTSSTWRWQMMLPSADESHETLWRQMIRWLAVSAPERITIAFDREFYNVGDEVNVSVAILDQDYQPDNDGILWMQTTNPLDQVSDTPMEWDITEDGVYRSSFIVEDEGVYNLLIDVASAASDASKDSSEKRAAFVVTPSLREYTLAGLDSNLLERIALASGGKYYAIQDTASLVNDIEFTPNAYSEEIQIDLWDSPWLLLLIISLLCADWITRRVKGLS